jgi:putative SOS response-associated peptidase YedK
MCGRYTSTTPAVDVAAYFDVDEVVVEEQGLRWNVAPTDEVYAVARSKSSGTSRLGTFRWGLVPFWAKDPSVGSRMINARAESVLEKSAFRRPMERYRCIVPADGFYEWSVVPGRKKKQPWHIRRKDGDLLAFAGLWSSWRPEKGSDEGRITSCTIITTDANSAMRPVHDRMPVILPPSAWAEWLDPTNEDVDALVSLLVPAPDELLELVAVNDAVSNVRNDGPHLLDPPPSEAEPTLL